MITSFPEMLVAMRLLRKPPSAKSSFTAILRASGLSEETSIWPKPVTTRSVPSDKSSTALTALDPMSRPTMLVLRRNPRPP
jgi:hypothetical protein